MRLLDAGGSQVFQDHLGERLLRVIIGARFGEMVDQLIVLVYAEYSMG